MKEHIKVEKLCENARDLGFGIGMTLGVFLGCAIGVFVTWGIIYFLGE